MTDLRSLLAAATPGPWRLLGEGVKSSGVYTPLWGPEWSLGEIDMNDDAALIVAAVNALPGLLDRIERLEEALLMLQAVCPHAMPHPGSGACMKCDAIKRTRAALEQP